MKNKFLKRLTIGLIAIVAGACFSACGDDDGEKKYDHLVTFNYNVGDLTTAIDNQYLGVMDGSLVAIKPGYSSDYKEGVVAGYYLEGWYTAKVDEEGNVVIGDDGRVELDEKWDFSTDRVSADIVLYANFMQQASLEIKGGDEVWIRENTPGTVMKQPNAFLAPKKQGYTLIGYYADEECTVPFTWPYEFEAGVNTVIYAKFMEGEWVLVDTAKEFSDALIGGKNIYLTSDITFENTTWKTPPTYAGEISGNGHTLRGIDVNLAASKTVKKNFGLFGTLTSTAYIHDLTIENARVSFTDGGFTCIGDDGKVALFAWKAEQGARISNVSVSGTLTEGTLTPESDITYSAFIAIDGGATLESCDYTQITIPQN